MSDSNYSTPEQIKLRVVETDESTTPVDSPEPAKADEPSPKETLVSNAISVSESPRVKSAAARMMGRSRNELLDIVAHPHADEDEWVAACHELERRGESPKYSPPARKRRRAIIWGACAAVLLLIGAVGLMHQAQTGTPTPGSQTATLPSSPPPVATIDWGPYMADMQRSIKHNWHPPKAFTSEHVAVKFKLFSDGHIGPVSLLSLSSTPGVNQAAIDAVQMTSMKPLPSGAPADVDIQFTFDEHVMGQDAFSTEAR